MKTNSRTKLRQLKTGVHLVCITDAVIIKDDDNMPKISAEGETGLTIRFSTGDNLHYDQDYWLNGTRHSYFVKMCASANINTENPKFRAESKGKRLWICIKEVHDIDGDKPVVDDIGGPSINYYMFDTLPCLDPQKRPVVKGNPNDNEGVASGMFLDYKQISTINVSTVHTFEEPKYTFRGSPTIPEKQKLSLMAEKLKEKLSLPATEPPKRESKSDEPINWDEF